jgi:hypothetical protein
MSGLTVWKFPLRWGEVSVSMPKHARIVHIGIDPASDYPAVWAVVRPDNDTETRSFTVIGTGHEVQKESVHVGSLIDDVFVWHVFETTPERVLAAMFEAIR